jgi:hypothetical protein
MVRLTVVTTFGLIGTVATGFLGMNLFDHTALDPLTKLGIFTAVFIPSASLAFYTIAKSKRLFAFLDALASDRHGAKDKLIALKKIWGR